MKQIMIWEGKLPSYWNITPWFHAFHNWVSICYRNEINNRVLEIKNIESNQFSIEKSFFNLIIGNYKDGLILARISDARSHILLEKLTCLDIMNRQVLWNIKEKFLLEKYKIPCTCSNDQNQISLGNKRIDVSSGEILIKPINNKSWFLGDDLFLDQEKDVLVCRNSQKIIWKKEEVHGSSLQGYNSQYLYFLIPENNILVLNREDGKQIVNIKLKDVRRLSGRLGGIYSNSNRLSHDSTTVFDILINNRLIVWINNSNHLVIMNYIENTQVSFEVFEQREVLLLKITNENFFVLENIDDEFGSIFCMSEGQKNEHSIIKR